MNQPNLDYGQELILYGQLGQEPLFQPLLAGEKVGASFYAALSERAVAEGWQGNILLLAMADSLLCADNAASRAAALKPADQLPAALNELAQAELSLLQAALRRPLAGAEGWQKLAADFPRLSVKETNPLYGGYLQQLAADFLQKSPAELWQYLAAFHQRFGCGELARYSFLEWREGLCGVEAADPVLPEQLFAYQRQKHQVLEHIAAFVEGKPAGNLLLYGERGSGKSSLVKAAVNHFAERGLRLLYLPRPAWSQLSRVLAALSAYGQRFIVFLDDFSFDPADDDYKQLKSVIEGGAASRPLNAMLVATSNRRHLVAESWRDRDDKQEEMYVADSTAEKLALSDRFAVTVTFTPPSQQDYLEIVAGLARLAGLKLPQEQLFAGAIRWERWYNARSGRTARQYIDHLLCQ